MFCKVTKAPSSTAALLSLLDAQVVEYLADRRIRLFREVEARVAIRERSRVGACLKQYLHAAFVACRTGAVKRRLIMLVQLRLDVSSAVDQGLQGLVPLFGALVCHQKVNGRVVVQAALAYFLADRRSREDFDQALDHFEHAVVVKWWADALASVVENRKSRDQFVDARIAQILRKEIRTFDYLGRVWRNR